MRHVGQRLPECGRASVRMVGFRDWRVLAISPSAKATVLYFPTWRAAQAYADSLTRSWRLPELAT